MSNSPDPNRTAAATPEQLKRSAELSQLTPEFPNIVGDRYELQGLLAKGGMGSVHTAWDKTFQRTVAVKLINENGVSELALARFKHESLISGQLQHPNIPPIYDLGSYDENRPFLAMKMVKGRTLADHIKHPDADTPNLIAVFENVCHAIGYAHSRSVIHRDLKPLNVMVGAFGEVQVMDWGLAKVLASRDASASGFDQTDYDPDATANLGTKIGDAESTDDSKTTAGTILGTPAYMPPEQAIGAIDQISERSDVFGLGAILCAILTGKAVFVGKDSESTRQLAARSETAEAFARLDACGAEPELIALAKKCLAAKPEDRFANGTEVANEVARIRAAAEERAKQAEVNRARSDARRRVLLYSSAIVFFVLVAGVVGTGLGLYRAEEARRKAVEAEGETARQLIETQNAEARAKREAEAKEVALQAETKALADAEDRRKQAEINLAYATKGNEILGSVFSGLDPKANYATIAQFRNALKNNLTKAVAELEGSAIGDPLVVAEMQNILGLSLIGLGDASLAIAVFENARTTLEAQLGLDHPHTLTLMNNLALGYQTAGKLDQALRLYEETLALRKAKLGLDHPHTLITMSSLAASYETAGKLELSLPLKEEVYKLQRAKLGPNDIGTLASMSNLAVGYQEAGLLDKALPLLEDTLKLQKAKHGPDHPYTLLSMANLARGYRAVGKLDLALQLEEKTLALRRIKLGPDHPDTLTSMNNLAVCYREARRLDRAWPLLEEVLARTKSTLGPDHPDTFTCMNNLALGYQSAGKFDRALPLFEETLTLRRTKLGLDHPHTLLSMNNLALCYEALGKLDLSLPLKEKTFKLTKAKLGSDHPDTLQSMHNLAWGYQAARKLDQALPLFEEALSLMKAKLGIDHPHTLLCMGSLALCYESAGKLDLSLPLKEEAFKLTKATLGPDHPDTLKCMNNLAWGYQLAGKLDLALPLYNETISLMKTKFGTEHPQTLNTMGSLAMSYRADGQWVQAIELLETVYAPLHRIKGPTDRQTEAIFRELVATYFLAGKGDQAETLLLDWLKVQRKQIKANSLSLSHTLAYIGEKLAEQKRMEQAIPLLRECLNIRQQLEPQSWYPFYTQLHLGSALLENREFDEAETHLIASYEGLIKFRIPQPWAKTNEQVLAQILEHLIELYTATNKPDEAKKYRELRAKYPKEHAPKPRVKLNK